MITAEQLAKACDCRPARALPWVDPINEALALFEINTPARQAAFLAQVAHESGRLVYVRELWGPTAAQQRYEGRADLGNVQPGDGFRYRGRGLIQTTGRANYAATRDGLRRVAPGAPDFEAEPEALELPRWAAMSAAWFWSSRSLNALADAGDFFKISARINGINRATGEPNGMDDRRKLWAGAKAALGVA
ncbi:MAG: glycoside hydrolase family 19 protein [Aquincola sp.]|nr:glycoside hydrolase family 19 protein [Aquincola sp.]